MDIAHLKTFLEIYHLRHFGRAADKLCITQSAASARIKLLEERLGVSLFIRGRHAIEPSSAGHRFYKYAELTVNGWERARHMVALPDSFIQSLAVGCLPDSWHLFLADNIAAIREHLPEVALNLSIHPGHNVQELLHSGALDLGFVFEPVNSPVLKAMEVADLELQLFANYPATSQQEALSAGYILVDWGSVFGYEHSRLFSDLPGAPLRTNSGLMALDLMKSGRHAAYLPTQVASQNRADITFHPVDGAPVFACKLYAVFRSDHELVAMMGDIVRLVTPRLLVAE